MFCSGMQAHYLIPFYSVSNSCPKLEDLPPSSGRTPPWECAERLAEGHESELLGEGVPPLTGTGVAGINDKPLGAASLEGVVGSHSLKQVSEARISQNAKWLDHRWLSEVCAIHPDSVGRKGRESRSAELCTSSSRVDPCSECSEIGRFVVLRARIWGNKGGVPSWNP